jgi:hypothetical protein
MGPEGKLKVEEALGCEAVVRIGNFEDPQSRFIHITHNSALSIEDITVPLIDAGLACGQDTGEIKAETQDSNPELPLLLLQGVIEFNDREGLRAVFKDLHDSTSI